ncbi:hypothetical protein D3C81_1277990 [compost metagenome]
MFGRQPAGGGTLAEVFDQRIGAVLGLFLEQETAGLAGDGDDAAAIDALGLHAGADEAAERVVAHAAQPADFQTQARQADGDIRLGAGQAARKVRHGRQVARLLGNEHRHRFAIGNNVKLHHAASSI